MGYNSYADKNMAGLDEVVINSDWPYYVYKLIDPRSGMAFYIGKGKNHRVYSHEREALKNKPPINKRKIDTIRAIWADGMQVIREIHSYHRDEQHAYDIEHGLIMSHKDITNISHNPGAVRTKKSAIPSLFQIVFASMRRRLTDLEINVLDKYEKMVIARQNAGVVSFHKEYEGLIMIARKMSSLSI